MVPILASRRPTHTFALKYGVTTTPTLATVAHALGRDFTDILRSRTSSGTRDPIRTRMVAAGERAVVRLGIGLAAGFTDDRPVSQPLSISLAEREALLFSVLGRRFPAPSFLRDE